MSMSLLTQESDPAVHDLRRKLDDFYNKSNEYPVFQKVSTQRHCWITVVDAIRRCEERLDRPVRVLEFGAARSGFGAHIAEQKLACDYHVQDITDRNDDYLCQYASECHYKDVSEIKQKYDVIFSTFVWEHVTNPRETLRTLLSMLESGGMLIIWSPRYDMPFYTPPALRHLSKPRQWLFSLGLWMSRIKTRMTGRPCFWIVRDPSLFHTDQWFRDSDAIHLVSVHDLRAALPSEFELSVVSPTRKKWITGCVQLRVVIEKTQSNETR